MSEAPLIDMRGNPVDESNLVDPGPNPMYSERRWRRIRDRFNGDFSAAHEEACAMSDELARLYRAEPVIAGSFNRRIERLDEVIARAEERVAMLKEQRASLEAGREAALKPNRTSRGWRLDRLEEFRHDFNAELRLTKNARSLRLTGGTFTFNHHNPKAKLIEQVGQDGTTLTGKTDEAALLEGLAVLRRCGLAEVYEGLVETKAKLALKAVGKLLQIEGGRPVIKCTVTGDHEGLAERVEAEGGTAWPQIDRQTGEVLGYEVTLPAVQVIRDASGQVVMQRELIREVAPEQEWTLGFKPAEPGQVETEEQEGETDGEA